MAISARRRSLLFTLAVATGLALTGVPTSPAAAFAHAASISGVVTGAGVDGTAIAGAEVSAYPIDSDFRAGWATTASDGTFTIANVRAGDYRIAVDRGVQNTTSRWANVPDFASATPSLDELATLPIVTVGDGEAKTDVNVTLPLHPVISGVIYISTGGVTTPVAGASVSAWNTKVSQVFFATSGADGSFSLPVAANTSYAISVSAEAEGYPQWQVGLDVARYIHVADVDVTGVDVTLAGRASISGRVSAAPGTELPGSSVLVTVRDEADHTVTAAGVRPDGTFTVGAIPAGSYRIAFVADFDMPSRQLLGYWQDASTFEEATVITLEEGENLTGIDMVFGTTPSAQPGAVAAPAQLAATGQDPAPAGLLAGLLLLAGVSALALRRMKPAAAVARATASRHS
jgi:LPXTG-motif cell wall-anchored protein